MKMKKMVGALALTAALAMGTAPAFAASASDAAENEFSVDGGSTEVKASVQNIVPTIKATVPLQVTVVFGSEGECEMTCPSPDKYAITNTGEGDIFVTEVEVDGVNELFVVNDAFTQGEAQDDPTLFMTYQTAGNAGFISVDHPLSMAVTGTSGTAKTERDILRSWGMTTPKNFSAEKIAVGKSLPITLGGAVYLPEKISQDNLTDTLMTIKYTISDSAA